jgi:hypothetical protein
MEMERVFRNDYTPLNRAFKFNLGDKATILEIRKPDIKISVNNNSFTIPYRDFIIITKQINFNEMTQLPTI